VTQYPNSFLQSESQPWGRSIEQRLADLERQDRLVAQESGNNFAQINSSITLLSAQISNIQASISGVQLLGKTTAAQTPSFSLFGNGTSNNLANSPSLSINLEKPARIVLSSSIPISTATGFNVASPSSEAVFSWRTNIPSSALFTTEFFELASGTTSFRKSLTLASSQFFLAPAGTFSVAPQSSLLRLNGGVGSFITAGSVTLSALVLPT